MIDYATLCRAIDDWKAGHQPSGVIPAAPKRVPTRPDDDEGVVEYSAAYDIGEARPEEGAVPGSAAIYSLPEYEDGEVEADGDVEAEGDVEADVEADADVDADVDADGETDVEVADDER